MIAHGCAVIRLNAMKLDAGSIPDVPGGVWGRVGRVNRIWQDLAGNSGIAQKKFLFDMSVISITATAAAAAARACLVVAIAVTSP